jgi:hypothetical protein
MKKFLLRRIGMADKLANGPPSLHDCMEVVLSQADLLMGDVLEGLVILAARTKSKSAFREDLSISKEAVDFLFSQKHAVQKTFKSQLRNGIFNHAVQDFSEQPQLRFADLQLLDSQQIDANIEFAMAQQEVLRGVDEVLPALNALVSTLLGWITVQPHLNPIKPDVFVRALQASLVKHAPDEAARAALITPAAGLLGVSLRQLYRELSEWLRSQGVDPASPVGYSAPGKDVASPVSRTLLSLDKLRKLLSGELDNGQGSRDFLHTVPASFLALEDLKLVEPMMKRLAQRASQSAQASAEADAQQPQITREVTQGRQLGQQLGAEVVRLMLDNLMQDQRLLFKVRTLIKLLEPALLALAPSDPRFFSERQHPARQFLDRITHRSLGYSSESDDGFAEFSASVAQAVDLIVQGGGDTAVFERVLIDLEAGWARHETLQRQQHEEAALALLHAEQRNLLAQRLALDFQERMRDRDIPELVSVFLRGPWAQVVAESQLGCADGSADPGAYLALVDDLLWSVQLRLARRNRTRLVQLVPHLLVKLRQGLQLIQYPQERIPVFFDDLISLHEKVFEGPRRQALAVPAALPPEMESHSQAFAAQTGLDDTAFWIGQDEAQESCYLADEAEIAGPKLQQPWSVADLETGVWVELKIEGVWLRAQLNWASPHRTLFMFVSRGGLAHSMSRRSMERLRMQGRIRVVSDGHVVENALDAVAQTALQNDLGQAMQGP